MQERVGGVERGQGVEPFFCGSDSFGIGSDSFEIGSGLVFGIGNRDGKGEEEKIET